MMNESEASVSRGPSGWAEWIIVVLLAVMALDVLSLFLAGVFQWATTLKISLAIFVYMQMAMTAASLISIPLSIGMKAWRGATGAR
jgi:hypothetical protein